MSHLFISLLPAVSYFLAVPFYRQFEIESRYNDKSKIDSSNRVIASSALVNMFGILNLYDYTDREIERVDLLYIIYGILITDTLEYFMHRLYHLTTLYTTFHKHHHSQLMAVDVSFLNSDFEALSTGLVLFLAYFSVLSYYEYLIISSLSMVATVSDHTYTSPTKFHQIHHHVNRNYKFQQPFFTFWDHLLGTYHPKTSPKIPFIP